MRGLHFPCSWFSPGTGVCEKGYYCPEGSSTATQFPCGGADRFCPTGSSTPILVRVGWYTNEDRHEDIRTSGRFAPSATGAPGASATPAPRGCGAARRACRRDSAREVQPRVLLPRGLYEPEASSVRWRGRFLVRFLALARITASPSLILCAAVIRADCPAPLLYFLMLVNSPEGSSEPTPVTIGFYSTHTGAYEDELQLNDPLNETMSAQLVCPPGYWCKGGKRFLPGWHLRVDLGPHA